MSSGLSLVITWHSLAHSTSILQVSKRRNSIGFKHQSSKGILHQSLQHSKKIWIRLEDLTSNSKTFEQQWNIQLQIQRHFKTWDFIFYSYFLFSVYNLVVGFTTELTQLSYWSIWLGLFTVVYLGQWGIDPFASFAALQGSGQDLIFILGVF